MSTPIHDRLRHTLGVDLRDLAGGSFAGELPLPNALVNRFITQFLDSADGPVRAAHVEAHDQDTMAIALSLRGPLPDVKLSATIEQQPVFPRPAVLGIRWSMPKLGPLALFAGPVMSYFKKLPPGVTADADRISVDIGELLRSRGLGEFLPYISNVRIHTREGAFLVRFEVRIT